MQNETLKFIYESARPPELDKPALIEFPDTDFVCAFTGEPITTGYPAKTVIKSATSEVAETFRYPSPYVSKAVAELFRYQTELRGNLIFFKHHTNILSGYRPDPIYLYGHPEIKGGIHRPMVSAESAQKQNRLAWSHIIHRMNRIPNVAVFSDESKRRLWHKAQLSTYGPNWRPYFHGTPVKGAPAISRTLHIDSDTLRTLLDIVEVALNHGFSKNSIAHGLAAQYSLMNDIDFIETFKLEKQLANHRATDEFTLAIFIAQPTLEKQQVQ